MSKEKIVVKGMRAHGRLLLSGIVKQGVDLKKIPPYFTIEINIKSIKKREKSRGALKE